MKMHEPKLWHCDVLQAPDAPESVDLIVTSPPYNLGMDYGRSVRHEGTKPLNPTWVRNWLDWQDRVDRGHPVFEIEVDDQNRQCERAKIITDELDILGKIEYHK